MDFIEKNKNLILVLLAVLNIFVFSQIFLSIPASDLRFYFLNVGQGDAQLVILPGEVKVLIDGGPASGAVLRELDKILKPVDRYIDLVIMSHPQLDHFGGLIDVLKRYRIGAFIMSGRKGETEAFGGLVDALRESGVRAVNLRAGDRIRYNENVFEILSPTDNLISGKEVNDASMVMDLVSKNTRTLFTGDITSKVEAALVKMGLEKVDILKVPHHGSKYSSSVNFLNVLRPSAAVIGVGKNSYGHPTPQALERLKTIGASIYRTDKDGTVEISIDGKSVKIFKEL